MLLVSLEELFAGLGNGQAGQTPTGASLQSREPIVETDEDDQDEQATTTAQIPTFPVPLGMPLRRAWPLPSKFTKKSPVAMGYGEYIKWLDDMRKKRLKGQEEPLWPSLLKV